MRTERSMMKWARRAELKGPGDPSGGDDELLGKGVSFHLERCIARDAHYGAVYLAYIVETGMPTIFVKPPDSGRERSASEAPDGPPGGLGQLDRVDPQVSEPSGPEDAAEPWMRLAEFMQRYRQDPAVRAHLSMPQWKWKWKHLIRRATQWRRPQ